MGARRIKKCGRGYIPTTFVTSEDFIKKVRDRARVYKQEKEKRKLIRLLDSK